ncbi:MAG: hypothetical protein ABI809_03460 [Caldimonas sp.]
MNIKEFPVFPPSLWKTLCKTRPAGSETLDWRRVRVRCPLSKQFAAVNEINNLAALVKDALLQRGKILVGRVR